MKIAPPPLFGGAAAAAGKAARIASIAALNAVAFHGISRRAAAFASVRCANASA